MLRGKGRRSDRAIVLIGARDDGLFHQVHVRLLLCLKTSAPLKDEQTVSPLHFFRELARNGKRKP
jgi:hypothetical protein